MPHDPYFAAIRKLAEYEVWCNDKMFEMAATLEATQLHQHFPFGLKTIHKTLWHIMEVLRRWSGCVGPKIAMPKWPRYNLRTSLASIASKNADESKAFLNAIDRSHAAGLLHRDRRIDQVFHLITHGTHHRTQIITMLRLLGKDPPFEAGDFGGWSNVK